MSGPDGPGGGFEAVPLVSVYVTTAVRISEGPGPGHKRVPPDEAGRLVGNRQATFDDKPRCGFEDGGVIAGDAARLMPRRA